MKKLLIKRCLSWTGFFTVFHVIVDNEIIGSIRGTQKKEFSLPDSAKVLYVTTTQHSFFSPKSTSDVINLDNKKIINAKARFGLNSIILKEKK